jgi:surfactin synthase thioesterase subunit
VVRLFCFPYAGASALVYARWRRRLPDWLDVRPVELPGRGTRFDEALHTDIDTLATRLAEELRPAAAGPFALFGHSLGALLAFEVAHRLESEPLALFVSGTHAPTRRNPARYEGLRTDGELIAELRKLNGTPPEVLNSPELLALTLPVLRADFQLCGGYRRQSRPPLRCAIHVFGGEGDETTPDTLNAWREETRGAFSLRLFDGGHFFIHRHEERILDLVRRHLEPPKGSGPGADGPQPTECGGGTGGFFSPNPGFEPTAT